MTKSLSVTFRVPAELVEPFTEAINQSGEEKTAWLISAVRHKLDNPAQAVLVETQPAVKHIVDISTPAYNHLNGPLLLSTIELTDGLNNKADTTPTVRQPCLTDNLQTQKDLKLKCAEKAYEIAKWCLCGYACTLIITVIGNVTNENVISDTVFIGITAATALVLLFAIFFINRKS
ncbi:MULTISPECIES: hypothetical protein [unclassified Cedecea]|uniref:hypothetical protein n=1 Tax=unclassified Cedecea TaxID=2649846 RepID=UPI0030173D1D